MDTNYLRTEVGRQVNTTLATTGVTRHRISELTGIPYTTLTRKLKGQQDFGLAELISIAQALNVSPAALIPESIREAA